MSNSPAQILNAFCELNERHQRKRMSAQTAFVAGVRFGETQSEAESRRLDWLDRHRNIEHDSDAKEHWIAAWLCQAEPGNTGSSGRFVARAVSFRACIDKFLVGDIVRID